MTPLSTLVYDACDRNKPNGAVAESSGVQGFSSRSVAESMVS